MKMQSESENDRPLMWILDRAPCMSHGWTFLSRLRQSLIFALLYMNMIKCTNKKCLYCLCLDWNYSRSKTRFYAMNRKWSVLQFESFIFLCPAMKQLSNVQCLTLIHSSTFLKCVPWVVSVIVTLVKTQFDIFQNSSSSSSTCFKQDWRHGWRIHFSKD